MLSDFLIHNLDYYDNLEISNVYIIHAVWSLKHYRNLKSLSMKDAYFPEMGYLDHQKRW